LRWRAGVSPNAAWFLEHGAEGAFGMRRLVAALESVFWLRNGSLLPFSGETNAWFQACGGNPGSKLPVWGSIRLLKAATSRRTPNVPSAPCGQNYAALGGTLAFGGRCRKGSQPPSHMRWLGLIAVVVQGQASGFF